MIRNNFYMKSAFSIWRVMPYGLIALIFAVFQPLFAAESSHNVCLRNAVIDTTPTVTSFQKTGNALDKFSADAAVLLSSGQESKTVNLVIQFAGPIQEEWKKRITVYSDDMFEVVLWQPPTNLTDTTSELKSGADALNISKEENQKSQTRAV